MYHVVTQLGTVQWTASLILWGIQKRQNRRGGGGGDGQSGSRISLRGETLDFLQFMCYWQSNPISFTLRTLFCLYSSLWLQATYSVVVGEESQPGGTIFGFVLSYVIFFALSLLSLLLLCWCVCAPTADWVVYGVVDPLVFCSFFIA